MESLSSLSADANENGWYVGGNITFINLYLKILRLVKTSDVLHESMERMKAVFFKKTFSNLFKSGGLTVMLITPPYTDNYLR